MSTNGQTNGSFVGRSLKRKEDPRFITGAGRYTDDVVAPGMLWAAFVRSPEAHARVTSIDVSLVLQLIVAVRMLAPWHAP